MIFKLTGDIPSLKNSKQIFCRGARPILIPSANYKAWNEETLWILKQYRPEKPISSCRIDITFFAKTKRLFDLDNKASSVLDTLVQAEILSDDTYDVVKELHLHFGGVDKVGGAIINIYPATR